MRYHEKFLTSFSRKSLMNDHTEWEIVDDPSSAPPRPRASLGQTLQGLLGRWWRWKVAGAAVLATLALAIVAALTGVAILVFASVAVLTIAISKLTQWLRGNQTPARVAVRVRTEEWHSDRFR